MHHKTLILYYIIITINLGSHYTVPCTVEYIERVTNILLPYDVLYEARQKAYTVRFWFSKDP